MYLEKLLSVICTELGIGEDEIDENTLIEEIVGDELETEDLVYTLEREFGIEFGGELSEDLSLAELADLIEETAE